ncbi:MAG: hypothetical protein DYH06_14135, partial [Acidobacteria bacterium ACB2]|nr:hypothetical protein [Acidobacteria bacterium ACB2]
MSKPLCVSKRSDEVPAFTRERSSETVAVAPSLANAVQAVALPSARSTSSGAAVARRTLSVASRLVPPAVAVTVATVSDVTGLVETANPALAAPCGTTTDAGTEAT